MKHFAQHCMNSWISFEDSGVFLIPNLSRTCDHQQITISYNCRLNFVDSSSSPKRLKGFSFFFFQRKTKEVRDFSPNFIKQQNARGEVQERIMKSWRFTIIRRKVWKKQPRGCSRSWPGTSYPTSQMKWVLNLVQNSRRGDLLENILAVLSYQMCHIVAMNSRFQPFLNTSITVLFWRLDGYPVILRWALREYHKCPEIYIFYLLLSLWLLLLLHFLGSTGDLAMALHQVIIAGTALHKEFMHGLCINCHLHVLSSFSNWLVIRCFW